MRERILTFCVRALFIYALVFGTSCENDVPLADAPIPSVRWEHFGQAAGNEPVCYNAIVTHPDADHVRCEWDCLMFWTNTHGAGRYYVSREWILVSVEGGPDQWVSGQFFPWPESQDEQSWPCE